MAELALNVSTTLPQDGAAGALAGRVWRPDVDGPSVVAIRATAMFDISRSFPTMRDLCEAGDPPARLRARSRRAHRRARRHPGQHAAGQPRRRQALAAGADRPAGDQGGRRDLRRLDARAGDRGARARRPDRGGVAIRDGGQPAGRRRLSQAEAGLAGGGAAEGGADRAGRLEPVSRGRHRPGRRDLHQGAADGGGRHRHGCRASTRTRPGTIRSRRWCWSCRPPAASSARRSATTSTCATSRAARRCCSARRRTTTRRCAIGPFLRFFDATLHARRHARRPRCR